MRDRYLPNLKRLEKNPQSHDVKKALVDGYFVLGDVHDFNNAPMQAVKAYMKSIKYFPDKDFWSEPWRELGNMYNQIGRYDEAIRCINRALKIDPVDKLAIGDLEVIESDHNKHEKPLHGQTNSYYHACELIAGNKAQAALRNLKKKRGLEAAILRACAYGQSEDYKQFIKEWERIARMKANIYLGYMEWYYMPEQCWERPELWELFYEIEKDNRFEPGIFLHDEKLGESLPRPKFKGDYANMRSDKRYMAWKHKYYMAMIRYMIAVTKEKESELEALAKKYPNWPEPQEALAKMSKKIR